MNEAEDGFCEACEVTLDLHDTKDGEDESDCELAGARADRLLQMFSSIPLEGRMSGS